MSQDEGHGQRGGPLLRATGDTREFAESRLDHLASHIAGLASARPTIVGATGFDEAPLDDARELARAVARRGLRVLVVDLRDNALRIGPGLSEVTARDCRLRDAVEFDADTDVAFLGPGREVEVAPWLFLTFAQRLPPKTDICLAVLPSEQHLTTRIVSEALDATVRINDAAHEALSEAIGDVPTADEEAIRARQAPADIGREARTPMLGRPGIDAPEPWGPPAARHGIRRTGLAGSVGLAAILAVVTGLALAVNTRSYDVAVGAIVGTVLFVTVAPIMYRLAAANGEPRIGRLLVAGLAAKFLGAVARYFVIFDVYGGGDAGIYARWGEGIADSFRAGIFNPEIGRQLIGTGFIRYVTGLVFTVIGPTRLGGFFVFSLLAFVGVYLFYRAFRIALPEQDGKRYAALVLFFPSLLFWPSSIGKEAWMLFSLGVAAYGAAKILTRQPVGYVAVAVGLGAAAMARPHIALLAAVGIVAGYMRRPPRESVRKPLLGPIPQAIGIVVVFVAGFLLLGETQAYFDVEEESPTSAAGEILETTEERTEAGGSQIQANPIDGLADLPVAVVTVLFRPFPNEAHNLQAFIAAGEGLLLLVIVLVSFRRLASVPRLSWRDAYVRCAAVYSLGFVIAYSSIGNLGILTRQRTQLWPFLFVLLAVLPLRDRIQASRTTRRHHPRAPAAQRSS